MVSSLGSILCVFSLEVSPLCSLLGVLSIYIPNRREQRYILCGLLIVVFPLWSPPCGPSFAVSLLCSIFCGLSFMIFPSWPPLFGLPFVVCPLRSLPCGLSFVVSLFWSLLCDPSMFLCMSLINN